MGSCGWRQAERTLGSRQKGVEVVFGELGREMEPVRDVLVSDRNRAKILR